MSESGGGMSWRFVTCAALFITCLLTANIIAAKLVVIGGVVLPAGIVIFPISYILADVLTEVWGYGAARRVIWLGFACNTLMVAATWVGGALVPAPFWKEQAAYEAILGQTPRLLGASFVAYLAGEFANAFVMAKVKIWTQGRWLWIRTIGSTIVGEGLDSAIFVTLAFGGTMPGGVLAHVVAGQWGAKDRKSTRLNSSHSSISYAVFCLKKKKKKKFTFYIYKKKKEKKKTK